MKKILFSMIIMFCCVVISQAQTYPHVKVTLKSGSVIKGKKGIMSNESVSLFQGGYQNSYPLSEVALIQAKEGKAGKWALGCGGGCLAICIISGVASGSEGIAEAGGTTSTYIAGCVIWTGIFAGVGAIIGYLSDDYENIYVGHSSSLMKKFNLDFSSNQLTKYNFTLSYKLPTL